MKDLLKKSECIDMILIDQLTITQVAEKTGINRKTIDLWFDEYVEARRRVKEIEVKF